MSMVKQDFGFCARSVYFWISVAVAGTIFLVGLFGAFIPIEASIAFGVPIGENATTLQQTWVRLMGVRDIALALMLFGLIALKLPRVVGLLFLLMLIVPFADCLSVLLVSGAVYQAAVHGVAAVFLAALGWRLVRG